VRVVSRRRKQPRRRPQQRKPAAQPEQTPGASSAAAAHTPATPGKQPVTQERNPAAQPSPQERKPSARGRPSSSQRSASQRRRPVAKTQIRRRQLWPLSGAGLSLLTVVVVGAGVAIAVALHGSGNPTGNAPFGTPLAALTPTPAVLAPVSTTVTGQPIDGSIQCLGGEQLAFHIHAHLAVYVGGSPRTVPEGIGILPPRQETQVAELPTVISGSCFYWLHSHTPDGIIHIESPVQHTYTLGNWFDIWGIPLDATHVGPATGTVVAYLNGQVYSGDIRGIPLDADNLIQLDVNGNVPPAPFTFPAGL
jgi:hypothetical protein